MEDERKDLNKFLFKYLKGIITVPFTVEIINNRNEFYGAVKILNYYDGHYESVFDRYGNYKLHFISNDEICHSTLIVLDEQKGNFNN